MIDGPILAIDTATSRAVVALGNPDGRVLASAGWLAGQRHSEELLPRVGGLLADAGLGLRQLAAVVVGTGPGAFTGLRVGLATAKTLAHQLGLPIAGVSSAEALLHAAGEARRDPRAPEDAGLGGRGGRGGRGAPDGVLLLPAGSTDRIVVRSGQPPILLPGGQDPSVDRNEEVVAVDLAGRVSASAAARGEAALAGLAVALVRLGAERLASGETDDAVRLVPEYVSLPRGVASTSGEIEWSRDRR